MKLFRGLDRAYGTYDVEGAKDGSSKLIGKAVTMSKPVTERIWEKHLSGEQGVGIVPIDDEGKSSFGAIDIDVYNGLDLQEIALKIYDFKLPLVPIRSKSGGCHLYLFLKDPISAATVQRKLREFAAAMGHGSAEVFPKQTRLLTERGDAGNWINMPYFGLNDTDRWAVKRSGERMMVDEFLEYAESMSVSEAELDSAGLDVAEELKDGPPCLEHLLAHGLPAGTRNDGLFNIGVFLRKAFPDRWQQELEEYNIKYLSPPLSASEVISVQRSVEKKEYGYTCHKPPIKAHCQASKCRLRKFGVGPSQGMPVLTGLTKYDSQPPIWFLDVDGGGRIELSTEDLQNQIRFQRRCMDTLNLMTPLQQKVVWQSIVQNLLEGVVIIEAPVDATPTGQLLEQLERFCCSRVQARNKEEMLLGKPWKNEGRHYFRLVDFISYLERQKIQHPGLHRVTSILKDNAAEHHFYNLKGKGTNCWSVPEFIEQASSHEPIRVEEKSEF
jgi:hypothetical protein